MKRKAPSLLALAAAFLLSLELAPAAPGLSTPYPGWVEERGDLRITVGELRLVIPGARGNLLTALSDGTLVVTGGNSSGSRTVRSEDGGQTWRRQPIHFPFISSGELSDGSVLILGFNPVPAGGGNYTLTRSRSVDGARTLQALPNGTLHLPPDTAPNNVPQWLHGPITELPNGDLIALAMGVDAPGGTDNPWVSYTIKSTDGGISWSYLGAIARQSTIQDPGGLLDLHDWPLYYANEPSMVRLHNGKMIAVMRSVNDERNGQDIGKIGPPAETWEDLHRQVAGDGIYPGLLPLPADRYYFPGPPNGPVVISTSDDDGATWSGGDPMLQARGICPIIDQCSEGFLAVTYGGLSGVPRWGHGIIFSDDNGETWTDEIVFAPFLTSGCSNMVSTGPGKFTVIFNVTPPQAHMNDGAWWIGAVDFTVERISSGP